MATAGTFRVLPTMVMLCAAMLSFAGPAPVRAEDLSQEFARGQELYRDLRPADARAAFQDVHEADPAHYGALCWLARVESELGEDAKGEAQRELVAAAVEHARAAVKLQPDSAQGHVWLAVALGRQALKEGPKTRLALSREIKSEVDRAIAIDPNIGRAYHVRALWNRRLASLNFVERAAANSMFGGVPKGATMENAVSDLEKAIALEPEYINHRLELGRTLLMLDRKNEAREELEKAIALKAGGSPRDGKYQAEAQELLRKSTKG